MHGGLTVVGVGEDLIVVDVRDASAKRDLGIDVALGDFGRVDWRASLTLCVSQGRAAQDTRGGRQGEERNRTSSTASGLGDKEEVAGVVPAALDRPKVVRCARLAALDPPPSDGRRISDEDLVGCRNTRTRGIVSRREGAMREKGRSGEETDWS
jgi:hypothetical protein